MNEDKLNKKLHLYYDKLNNPSITIGDWNIVDEKEFKYLKKITLTAISTTLARQYELVMSCETKNKFIFFKYNSAFIATKTTDTEYEYITKDWNLIAANNNYLQKGTSDQKITNENIFKLLGIKLSKKAKLDLENIF